MQNIKETYLNLMGQQINPSNVAALSDGIYFKMTGGEKMRMFLKGGQWINPLAQAQEGEETIYADHDKVYDYKLVNGQWQTRRKGTDGDWIDLSSNEAATKKLNTAYPDALKVIEESTNNNTNDEINQNDLNSIVDDSGGQSDGLQLNKDNLKFVSPTEGNVLSPLGDNSIINLVGAIDATAKSFGKDGYYDPGTKADYTKFSHTNTTDEDLYIDPEALAKGKKTGDVFKDAEQMTEIEMQKHLDERAKNNPQMYDKVKNFDADLFEKTGYVDRRRGLFNRKVNQDDFKEGDYLENKYKDASHIGFSVDEMGKYTKGFDYLTANEDGETFNQQSFDGYQNSNSGGDDSREYERSDKHNDDYNFANETSFESYRNAGINHNMTLDDDDPFGYTKIPSVGPLTPMGIKQIPTNTPEPELMLSDPTELYLDNIEKKLRKSQGPLDQTDPEAVINANDQISLDEANQRYADDLNGLVPRAKPVGPRADGRGLRYGGSLPKAQAGITEFELDENNYIQTERGYDKDALFNFAKDKYTKVNTASQKSALVTKLNSPAFRERYRKNIFNISGENLSEEELTNRINQQSDFTEAGPDFHVTMPYITTSHGGYKNSSTPYINPFAGKDIDGNRVGLQGVLDFRRNQGLYQQKNTDGRDGTLYGNDFYDKVTNPDFPELAKYPYIPQLNLKRDPYLMGDNQIVHHDDANSTIVHEYAHSYNTDDSPLFNPAGKAFASLDKNKYDESGNLISEGNFRMLPGDKYKGWLSNLFGEDYFDKEKNKYGTWAMHPWEISSIRSETEAQLKNNNIWDNTKGEFGEANLNKMIKNDSRLDIGGPEMDHLNRMGYTALERMNYKNKRNIRNQDDANWSIDNNPNDYILDNIINAEDNPSMDMDAFNIIFNNSQSNLKDKQKYSDYNSLLEDYKNGNKRKKKRATEIINTINKDVKYQINQGYNTENENYQIEYNKKKGEVLPKLKQYFNEIVMDDVDQPARAKYGGSLPKAQNGLREFCANAPIIDSGGKVFAPCQNREYDSEHIGELGATMSVGKLDDEFTSSFGLSGGYTFNPSGGTGGLKTYLGGNYGLRATENSSIDDGLNGTNVDLNKYMKGLASLGYTGEVGGNSHNWRTPTQFELGAYANKDLMGDDGTTFGGYGRFGPINIKAGYNRNTGSEFSVGFGLPIRQAGGWFSDAWDSVKENTSDILDYTQTGLTAGGLTPAYGIFADAANTLISGGRAAYAGITGDDEGVKTHTENALLNATSAIPGPVGWTAGGIGLANDTAKYTGVLDDQSITSNVVGAFSPSGTQDGDPLYIDNMLTDREEETSNSDEINLTKYGSETNLQKFQFAGSPGSSGYNPLTNQFTPTNFNTELQVNPLSMNMLENQTQAPEKTEPFFNADDRMYAMNQSVNRSMDSFDAFSADMNKRMQNPTLQMNQVDTNPLSVPDFSNPELDNQMQMNQDMMAFKTASAEGRTIGNTIIPTSKETKQNQKEFGKKMDETLDNMPKYEGTQENLNRFDRANELGFDGDLVAMDEYDQNETEEGIMRALREEQLNKDNKDANPSFGDTLWNIKNRAVDSKVGQTYQNIGAGGTRIAKALNPLLRQREESKTLNNQMQNAYLSDNMFASRDADLSGSKGDYDVNSGIFRAEDKITTRQGKYGAEISNYLTFAKNGGSFYNDGGEAEIDANMYKELIAAGADLEII